MRELIKDMKPETRIVVRWRQAGNRATLDAINNVRDAQWCRSRIASHQTAPLSKGDLGLLMEYASDVHVREWCRQLVIDTGKVQ